MSLHATALIPARLNSSRFPAKLLQNLGNLPVIVRTYQAVSRMQLFQEVIVVTDSERICECVEKHGGQVRYIPHTHESGTDRIAEAVADMTTDIALNVQGDEPFIAAEPLRDLVHLFERDTEKKVQVASLMTERKDVENMRAPSRVKVIVDSADRALYFSRALLPFVRDDNPQKPPSYFQHIGVYAFRKNALLAFPKLPIGALEEAEKIECLRFLENGISLHMLRTKHVSISIDTPEDLVRAEAFLHAQSKP